jgi:hypothetical protein
MREEGIDADDLRIGEWKNSRGVHRDDDLHNQDLDTTHGKPGRTADASVVLVWWAESWLDQIPTDTCVDQAGRSCRAHRSQRIADIEREVVSNSAKQYSNGNQTQGGEFYYASSLI